VTELRAIAHLAKAGEDVWIIDPNAVEGHSPDAIVVLSGHEVAAEVKAKISQPVADYRPSLIQNPLSEARKKQLPPRGPSIIYLQIASPWSDDEHVLMSIDETVKAWLRNTRRVNAVVLMVERTFIREDGNRSYASGTLTIPNENPYVWVPDLQDWLLVRDRFESDET
jgi:hypothetical protein